MTIVFFGSSGFAVSPLKALLNSKHRLSCAVTQPDRKRGRGLAVSVTPVKACCQEYNVEVYQPQDVNALQSVKFFQLRGADIFVVSGFGQLISEEILKIPKIFCLNIHASLLPKYRGAAPIHWAIINAEKTTGVTIMKMAKKMDAGPIILQEAIDINPDDTAITLEEKLSCLAAELLMGTLTSIEKNTCTLTEQNESAVSFARKLKKEDGLIHWEKGAQEIANLIRGTLKWPGAYTYYKGKILKIYKAGVTPRLSLPRAQSRGSWQATSVGEIIKVSKEGIVVATGKDDLVIEELQIEGKRRMSAQEFIAGHKIKPGEKLA